MNRCTLCGVYTSSPFGKSHLASKRHQAALNLQRVEDLRLETVTRWERDLLTKAGITVEHIVTKDGPMRWGRSQERGALYTWPWAARIVRAWVSGQLTATLPDHVPLLQDALTFAKADESFREALLSVIDVSKVPFDANGAVAAFVHAYKQRSTAP